jgi:hypothetical protein
LDGAADKEMTMPESALQNQVERTSGGQSVKGHSDNPAGKPAECRNHVTRTAEAEALTRKAVTLALDGDGSRSEGAARQVKTNPRQAVNFSGYGWQMRGRSNLNRWRDVGGCSHR